MKKKSFVHVENQQPIQNLKIEVNPYKQYSGQVNIVSPYRRIIHNGNQNELSHDMLISPESYDFDQYKTEEVKKRIIMRKPQPRKLMEEVKNVKNHRKGDGWGS